MLSAFPLGSNHCHTTNSNGNNPSTDANRILLPIHQPTTEWKSFRRLAVINMKRLLTLLLVLAAAATLPAAERTLSLDSGYLRQLNSNRGLRHFGMEWTDVNSWAFDALNEAQPFGWSRDARLLLWTGFSLYTADVYNTFYHEFGHGSRLEALGYRTRYRIGSTGDLTRSPWTFFVRRFGDPFNDAYAVYSTSDREFTSPVSRFVNSDGTLTNDGQILINAGGLNNAMSFSGSLSDRLRERGGHVGEGLPYLLGKLDATFYGTGDTGDLKDLETYYGRKGVSVSDTDLRLYNVLATAASQSTWAYLLGLRDYVANGDTRVEAMTYRGFALPDVENYLNTRGVSWKVSSGYRLDDDTYFPFAIDFITRGAGAQDYNLGVRRRDFLLPNSEAGLDFILGSGLGVSTFYSKKLYGNLSLTVGWDHFNGRNLHGERNAVSFKRGETSDEIWARLSLSF